MGTYEEQLGVQARAIVEGVVAQSVGKHDADEFLSESPESHEDRAMRHLLTGRLMCRREVAPDEEGPSGHLARAITRLVMAYECKYRQAELEQRP